MTRPRAMIPATGGLSAAGRRHRARRRRASRRRIGRCPRCGRRCSGSCRSPGARGALGPGGAIAIELPVRVRTRSGGRAITGGVLLRSAGGIPSAVLVLLPAAVIAASGRRCRRGPRRRCHRWSGDEPAAAGSAAADSTAFVRAYPARRRAGPAVGDVPGLRPVVAALDVARAPVAVDVRALARLSVRAGSRVVGLRGAACAVGAVGRCATRVRAGARVVPGGRSRRRRTARTPRRCGRTCRSTGCTRRAAPYGTVVAGSKSGRSRRTRCRAGSTSPIPTPRSPRRPSCPCSPRQPRR